MALFPVSVFCLNRLRDHKVEGLAFREKGEGKGVLRRIDSELRPLPSAAVSGSLPSRQPLL